MKGLLAAIVLAASCQLFAQAKPAAPAKGASVEQELIKLENDWNNALVKRDVTALSGMMAEDWTVVDPEGTVENKTQFLAEIKSGEDMTTSAMADEMKVRVYGDAGVVLGRNTVKEKYKGKDVSGQYRFTDTWVKKAGRWQCVATAVTKITKR
ncbi:MAG: nuclear transport factor 2 family protein [Acidobacteriia bacterium]|nr:nuclear transport factor 2 family protein [Terriglobia bacterium]